MHSNNTFFSNAQTLYLQALNYREAITREKPIVAIIHPKMEPIERAGFLGSLYYHVLSTPQDTSFLSFVIHGLGRLVEQCLVD